eukprot:TRINITY_DN360_c0_g1_i3.p2 TRINITY_DN360_c0_g1~~TRINITY_DN360_c0_g1_i3.p2  ORF type:complete len:98 (-),score=11.35 TRINITY_DN360_c0_g1_i3:136-429(-)
MDNRRDAANKAMARVGQANVDLDHIYTVLSTPPVLARDTTYTTLMSAELGTYSTIVRTHQPERPMSQREIQLWRAVIDRWLTGHGFRSLTDRPGIRL